MDIGYLELCIGPMFAGKTSYLLNKIKYLNSNNIPFTVLKPSIDNRYATNKITSHDKISYDCTTINSLEETNDIHLEKVILIEEAQFFPNISSCIIDWVNSGKTIYAAFLNGDSNMNVFGDVSRLYAYCDNIIFKKATCICGDEASFTMRKASSDEQVLVGGADMYMSVCRKCFKSNNI